MVTSLKPYLTVHSIILLCLLAYPLQEAVSEEKLFVVHFSTGSAWDTTRSPSEQTSFAEHSANLGRLRSEGIILFGGRYDEFGIIILRAATLESARETIESDPGIKSDLFTFTISPISVFYKWKE